MLPVAVILSVGDELVLGQTIDTNSAWIAANLAAIGCDIAGHATVPDDQAAIEAAISAAVPTCDFLIVSGGIGPTPDDLTRQALAKYLGVELHLEKKWLAHLKSLFASRNREMPEMNQIQAMIPAGAAPIDNPNGTAAGISVSVPNARPGNGGCSIFVLPGVPKEMKSMFTASVLPLVSSRAGGAVILQRTLHSFGLGESAVAEKLGALMTRGRNPSVGTTVANGFVSIRINSRFNSSSEAIAQLEATEAACCKCIGDFLWGRDGESLPQVVADMLASRSQQLKLTVVEMGTGGAVVNLLHSAPGMGRFVKSAQLRPASDGRGSIDMLSFFAARNTSESDSNEFCLAVHLTTDPPRKPSDPPLGGCMVVLGRCEKAIELKQTTLTGQGEELRLRAAHTALTVLREFLLRERK